jgi:hypothetical protein
MVVDRRVAQHLRQNPTGVRTVFEDLELPMQGFSFEQASPSRRASVGARCEVAIHQPNLRIDCEVVNLR